MGGVEGKVRGLAFFWATEADLATNYNLLSPIGDSWQ